MFLYTNVVLVDRDNEHDLKLCPIAFKKSEILAFRGFEDTDDTLPQYKRHGAITMMSGEVHVTATFLEIKKQLDPDSPDGGILSEVGSPPPTLNVGQ